MLIKIKLWIDAVAGSSDNTNNYCLHNIDAQFAATGNNIDLITHLASQASQITTAKKKNHFLK
jgi:hypothetical protein